MIILLMAMILVLSPNIAVAQTAGDEAIVEAERELAGGNFQKAELLFAAIATQTRTHSRKELSLRCRALIGLATAELRERKLDSAAGTIERALLLCQQSFLASERARALTIKGSIARAKKQFPQAIAAFAAAAKIYNSEKDKKAEAEVLTETAETHRESGARVEAIRLYEQLLKLQEEIGEQAGLFTVLYNLGTLYTDQAQYDRANELSKRLLDLATAGNDPATAARAHFLIGSALSRQGKYNQAISLYEEALAIYKDKGDKLNTGLTLNRLGTTQTNLGNYQQARLYFEQALEIYETLKDPVRIGWILQNLSAIAFYQADYRQAVSYSERALKIFEQHGDERRTLIALNNLSLYYSEQGDYKQAFEYYGQAAKLAEKLGDQKALATSFARLGAIYMAQREYHLGIDYFKRALKIQTTAANHSEICVLSDRIAQGLIELNDHKLALEWTDRAIALAREKEERLIIAETLTTKARVLRGTGDLKGALAALDEVLKIAQELNGPALYWPVFHLQGLIARDQGDIDMAIAKHQQAIVYLRNIRNHLAGGEKSEQFFLRGKRQGVYKDLIELLIKSGRTREALEYIEETKQRELTSLYQKAGSRPASPAEAKAYEHIKSLAARVRALDQELATVIEQDRRKLLQDQLSILQAEHDSYAQILVREHPRVAEILGLKPISFASIQASLPDRVLILEPFALSNQVVVFAFDKNQLLLRALQLKPEELDRAASVLRGNFSRSRSGNAEETKTLSRQIYNWLISPFEKEVAKAEHLIVIADGKLRYLPIQALWNGEQFLIERIPVSYVATAASLIFYTEAGSPSKRTGVLGIGNPMSNDRLLALPFAEAETREFGKIFGERATIRIGAQATKVNFLSDAAGAVLIHLATHAILDAEQPERSYILLAGENEDQRRLNYGEIPQMETQLRGANLITLSACETALGGTSDGLEISGLSEQFRQAGVHSVIASLWKVNDQSTRVLMTEFYSQLKAGRSRATALRAAQLQLIRGSKSDYSDPFFWAPFILIGDYR
jgi:CHAT domain-containing protein/TolA-binding protein